MSGVSAANQFMIRANTLKSLQRFQQLYKVSDADDIRIYVLAWLDEAVRDSNCARFLENSKQRK
ncbi:MAG: hypothetical protein AB8B71_09040 [Paracoccaceae bacterium]